MAMFDMNSFTKADLIKAFNKAAEEGVRYVATVRSVIIDEASVRVDEYAVPCDRVEDILSLNEPGTTRTHSYTEVQAVYDTDRPLTRQRWLSGEQTIELNLPPSAAAKLLGDIATARAAARAEQEPKEKKDFWRVWGALGGN